MLRPFPALVAAVLALTGCAAGGTTPAAAPVASDWDAVLAQAKGQTVRWAMYGGDAALNTFVTGHVADQLDRYGVTLEQRKVTDTADVVGKLLAEKQAGRTDGGSVDLVWINGENFATGQQAKLWHCGWDRQLPNARYVDFTDPAVTADFGRPVEGCEAVWQQASSALVYDSAALGPADVRSVSTLLAWAKANPGRFTYPAPPDFTGSMAVRTVLYDTAGDPSRFFGRPLDEAAYGPVAEATWRRLADLAPALWRGGGTYPATQADTERLYGDGEIAAFFTYGPGAVANLVKTRVFPATTRTAVLEGGNIGNRSFVAIPANSPRKAAALVLANVLQDPATQLALYRAEGAYPGIDVRKAPADVRAAFEAAPASPAVLPVAALLAKARPELDSTYLTRIEADWKRRVQQGSP